MRLYNTLTRQKEEFVPLEENKVRMYSCGPTVYNYAHIGNLRTYVFMDILRRTLKYNGYELYNAMNITDVGHLVSDEDEGEDKMLKGAREQKKTPWEIAEYFTDVFMKDIAALNIEKPEVIPKATEHIKEMINFVEGLLNKGYAYETSDGIYFDISKFEDYGKLSRLNLEEQMAGARVEVNDEKRHPADFALWKKAPKEHIMQWESPWGMGYPGWHIECSAMSKKYLGDTFDIHTGGVDHIPVHHENEIAQSEALIGEPAVKYWLHGEFMMVNNGKMSKSLGNTYTIADLREKGYNPLAFRYMCLNAHYRNKLNFTWDVMQASQVSYDRFIEGALQHKEGAAEIPKDVLDSFLAEFEDAINDDLNIPKALGVAWNMVRYPEKSKDIYQLLLKMDEVFGLGIKDAEKKSEAEPELDKEIEQLIEERQQARKEKNWKLSDEIRDKLKEMGIELQDTPQGVKWRRI
ncbi:MAG TPA: cysteine--tRNA ligase [Clostridiaceae bacterium]|jgi:cysteinyl-tRNA synthetase|nr:cysteine--tRNA ligase [Clostridiaceae bacterium]